MRLRRRPPAALVLALCLLSAASARADVFGGISLVSSSPFQQADYAHDPAVSGNGRYVVFDGSVGGVTGVWRKEIGGSGDLEEVAGGDARLPSISEDGQYVSFTTNEGKSLSTITDGEPDPVHHTGEAPNVYVRNMDFKPEEAEAFEIVSAPSGSQEPLTYEAPAGEGLTVERYGSIAAGRSAITANGREVVFVTTAVSNLLPYPLVEAEEEGRGETPKPHTPPLQVAVRNLQTDTTQLVSARRDQATGLPATNPETGGPEAVPLSNSEVGYRGAVYTVAGPPAFEGLDKYKVDQHVGASISADGSTIAWMGQDLAEQAAELPSEHIKASAAEPLWRRIGEGEQTPTRRVTGGSEPENPACQVGGEQTLPSVPSLADPCQGPFDTNVFEGESGGGGVWLGDSGNDDPVPQLSADGYEVAFLADASLVAVGEYNGKGESSDLYLADMRPGLTRREALTPLTEIGSGNEADVSTNGPITDLAISPDGEQVAFTTQRTEFALGIPAYITQSAAQPGLGEVFDVDLANQTLTRVTRGYEGGPAEYPLSTVEVGFEDPYFGAAGAEDGSLSPSFADSGNLIAFSSTASNLVYGDGNTPTNGEAQGDDDGADAFLVGRDVFTPEPAETYVSAAPPNPVAQMPWLLGLTAASISGGRVQLYLELPAGGRLSAHASAAIKVRRKVRHGGRTTYRTTLAKRTLASVAGASSAGGLTVLTLKLGRTYDTLASRPGGLPANATVSFSAPGYPALQDSIEVTFKAKPAKSKQAAHSSSREAR